TYKCVRTADGGPGAATLSAQIEWSACVSKDGQHIGVGVHKPSRRSALPVTAPLGEPPAPVGSGSHPFPQGSSYSRSPQLRDGPVVEGRPSSSRLVSTPSGDRADLAAFFQGAGGSVCEQTEHLLPSLVLARGRRSPTGH